MIEEEASYVRELLTFQEFRKEHSEAGGSCEYEVRLQGESRDYNGDSEPNRQ